LFVYLDSIRNALHGSSTEELSKKEIDFFFPQITIEHIPGVQELHELMTGKPLPRRKQLKYKILYLF
jgi:hypothetical protein